MRHIDTGDREAMDELPQEMDELVKHFKYWCTQQDPNKKLVIFIDRYL